MKCPCEICVARRKLVKEPGCLQVVAFILFLVVICIAMAGLALR